MKNIFIISMLAISLFACDKTADDGYIDQENSIEQRPTDQQLTIKFSTTSPNGEYAPAHILAVWIETEGGAFVRTLKVRAAKRKTHLYTWKSRSESNINDAITGATISQHTSHSVDWNLLDASQDSIANGEYILKLELTDQNAQGPVVSFAFTYQDSIRSQAFEDQENFKAIEIKYLNIAP